MHAEREAQRLERLAAKNAEAALFVDQREHTRNAARKDSAETKQGNEVTAAAKVTERATRRLDQQEQATMAARELARNQESTARVSNAVATSRITATNRAWRDLGNYWWSDAGFGRCFGLPKGGKHCFAPNKLFSLQRGSSFRFWAVSKPLEG